MRHDTPLLRLFQTQLRVVGALLIREILTRYGRRNIGFSWVFPEPMMFTLGVIALQTLGKATHGPSLPITTLAIVRYSSVLVWRNSVSRYALTIGPNQNLLYHRNVQVIDLFLSRVILEIAGATVSFLFLVTLSITLGMMEPPAGITQIVGGWTYLSVFGIGPGFIVGALSERSEVAKRIQHTAAHLLPPLSGVLSMVDWMPRTVQRYVLLFSMVHGVEIVYEGCFGTLVRPHYDIGYMVIADLATLLVGLLSVTGASK